MNIFRELRIVYDEINNFYSINEFKARCKGWHVKEKLWSRKKLLNDHAYFLFAFTRLEDRIREQSSKLIERKQTSLQNWQQRSAWDILPKEKDSDSPYFKNRLALVIHKGSHDYGKVVKYYEWRNELGHGGYFGTPMPVSIPNVLIELEILYSKIIA